MIHNHHLTGLPPFLSDSGHLPNTSPTHPNPILAHPQNDLKSEVLARLDTTYLRELSSMPQLAMGRVILYIYIST